MGHQSFSLQDILTSMKESSRMIQVILGGIYERTREIGVMKVISARLTDIRKLFLIEAGLIGFLGGVLGIGASLMISLVLNRIGANFMGPGSTTKMSVIPFQLAVMAVGFSTLIGIIAGYSPARRAMRLSALEAIRNE